MKTEQGEEPQTHRASPAATTSHTTIVVVSSVKQNISFSHEHEMAQMQ